MASQNADIDVRVESVSLAYASAPWCVHKCVVNGNLMLQQGAVGTNYKCPMCTHGQSHPSHMHGRHDAGARCWRYHTTPSP